MTDCLTVTLPWPDKSLSPNSRTDRRATTAIRQRARLTGFALTREAMGGVKRLHKPVHVSMTFHPPDRRRRDSDNLCGICKYHRDGIAKAIGVDDYHWSLSLHRADPDPDKKGFVIVEIYESTETVE